MRLTIAILLLASALPAQYPISANALHWSGTTSSAGPFCWGFTCNPETAAVVPGESGTFTVRGAWNQPFALAIAPTASRCLALPGIFNALVLDDPIYVTHTGVLNQLSPILACPSGMVVIPIVLPPWLPPGLSFSVQGLVGVPGDPALPPTFSFTQAITFTVI